MTSEIEDKFWKRVQINEGCWLWKLKPTSRGYGAFTIEGHPYAAHRVAYQLTNGAIPDGHVIRHTCDVPMCVNPDHLITGTIADNNQDMMNRGRHKPGRASFPGETNAFSKLTDLQRRTIIQSAQDGTPRRHLAKQYGVSKSTIDHLITGRSWMSRA